jgi:hypothetical protein
MKSNTYLNATLPPYRRGQPSRPIVIAKRSIQSIEPSFIVETIFNSDGSRRRVVRALGYVVTYRIGRETRRAGTTAEELLTAGLPVPAMPRGSDCRPRKSA